MSELASQLFDSLKGVKEAVQAVAPGLKDLVPEAKAEMSRLGTQGAMELASALFNGNSFVPYGPGQYTPSSEQGKDVGVHGAEAQKEGQQLEQSRGR
jgi:hypothetical protein